MANDPFADRHDQSRLLRQVDEFHRLDDALSWFVPTQERFDGNDLFRAVVNRLVVDVQFLALQRVMQALFDRQTANVALVHAGHEELRLIPAELFRSIHRAVGALQQRLHVLSIGGENADADARGDEELVSVDVEGAGQRLQDLPRHAEDGVGAVGVIEQDREFVAAEARDRV